MHAILKGLRERTGLSVKEAALQLKVHPATIYYWESGKKIPDRETLGVALDLYKATPKERADIAHLLAFGKVSDAESDPSPPSGMTAGGTAQAIAA